MSWLRATSLAALLAGLSVMLGACNTIAGMGRDVEAAGSAVAETADETKEKITE